MPIAEDVVKAAIEGGSVWARQPALGFKFNNGRKIALLNCFTDFTIVINMFINSFQWFFLWLNFQTLFSWMFFLF